MKENRQSQYHDDDSSGDIKLLDAVALRPMNTTGEEESSSSLLEGVVVYLNGETVGVRMTGGGSSSYYKEVSYPAVSITATNSASETVWTNISQVSKRRPTNKLEELQLRLEVARCQIQSHQCNTGASAAAAGGGGTKLNNDNAPNRKIEKTTDVSSSTSSIILNHPSKQVQERKKLKDITNKNNQIPTKTTKKQPISTTATSINTTTTATSTTTAATTTTTSSKRSNTTIALSGTTNPIVKPKREEDFFSKSLSASSSSSSYKTTTTEESIRHVPNPYATVAPLLSENHVTTTTFGDLIPGSNNKKRDSRDDPQSQRTIPKDVKAEIITNKSSELDDDCELGGMVEHGRKQVNVPSPQEEERISSSSDHRQKGNLQKKRRCFYSLLGFLLLVAAASLFGIVFIFRKMWRVPS